MKSYFKYPAFLLLHPVFFFLLGYTEHSKFLQLNKIIFPYILVYGCIIGSYLLLNLIKKQTYKNALWILYVASVYLFFGNIKGRFDAVFSTGSYTMLCLTLVLIPVLTLILTRKYPRLEKQLFSYANVLLVALCLTQCILLSMTYFKPDKYQLSQIPLQNPQHENTPSIHLIVWDGYPGFHSLQKYFNFSNDEIKQQLNRLNYFVFDSINSNYFQTYISINALLNMQYISYLHQVPLNQYYHVVDQLKQKMDIILTTIQCLN